MIINSVCHVSILSVLVIALIIVEKGGVQVTRQNVCNVKVSKQILLNILLVFISAVKQKKFKFSNFL